MVDELYNRHIRRLEGRLADLQRQLDEATAIVVALDADAPSVGDSYLKSEHIDAFTGLPNEPIITNTGGKIARQLWLGTTEDINLFFIQGLGS